MTKPDMILVHSDQHSGWVFDDGHPTQGRRYPNAYRELNDLAALNFLTIEESEPRTASFRDLLRVHHSTYIETVLKKHESNEWNGQRPDLAALAALFAGGTLTALDHLIEGDTLTAVHFPGAKHHAAYDHSSGFCVFNDFAIAADIATEDHGLTVAILDIDAHHGDGTENLTRYNGNVMTYSIHEFGIFPMTGYTDDAANLVFNLPLLPAAGDRLLHLGVHDFLNRAKDYDLIFIAAGADGHETDPLSSLGYTLKGYIQAARMIRRALPTKPILIGGAGGYQPDDFTPMVWAGFAATIASPDRKAKP